LTANSNYTFLIDNVFYTYQFENEGSYAAVSNVSVANDVYAFNVAINTTSLSISNSTLTFTLRSPTLAQKNDGNYYLNANGSWNLVTATAASVNTDAQYVWNNTHIFNSNLTVNGSILSVNANASFAKISTFNANVILGSSGLSANGSFGTAGQVLHSNGTATYWAADDAGGGTVTSVASGNGLSGGPITTTGTLSVLANTGIVSNTTGLFVNSGYIGTLTANNTSFVGSISAANVVSNAQLQSNLANYQTTAGLSANVFTLTANNSTFAFGKSEGNLNVNSAIYANGSITNTFTVGTSAYFVSNGNVGIGTSSPSVPLQIAYTSGVPNSSLLTTDTLVISAGNTSPGFAFVVAGNTGATQRGVFKATRTRGTLENPTAPNSGDDTFTLIGAVYDGAAVRATAAVNMAVDGSVSSGVAPQRITFLTGNASSRIERMRIDSSGNVGIGNTAPNATLAVTGTANISGNVIIGGITTLTGNVVIGTTTPSSSAYPFYVESASGLLVSAGSNVAATSPTIGVSRRRTGLASVISGDSLGEFSGFGWDGASFIEASRIETVVDGSPSTNDMPGRLVFSTTADGASSPTERMRITSTGDVGIGNTAPNARLQVTGTANVSGNVVIGGISTFDANVVLGSVGLSSNGSFGTAGHVLHSNGTATYWAADDNSGGTVTSVASGNGITGGTITSTGTLTAVAGAGVVVNTSGINVLANNGITSNSTGTFAAQANGISVTASGINVLGGPTLTVNTSGAHVNSTLSIGALTTTGNVAIGGITTFSGNIILGSSGFSANGSFGTAGHVLHSNGTATYWAADDNSGGTVTSVATGNGMTGGTITTTGTVSVLANTGIVANATGVFVNDAHIATLSANSATFLGAAGNFGNSTGIYTSGTVNAVSFTAGTLIANNSILRSPSTLTVVGGGATAEGGQIVIGYGNNLATTITGQANNTFNIDVTGGNTGSTPLLRIFAQNGDGTTTAILNAANTGRMHVGSTAEQTDSTFKVTGTANVTSTFRAGGAATMASTLNVTGVTTLSANLSVANALVRSWSATDTDIDSLLPGSTFGTIIEGAYNGHLVLGIRDNDASDSVSIISGGGDYAVANTYDQSVAFFRADGRVSFGRSAPGTDLELYRDANTISSIAVRNANTGASAQARFDLNTGTTNSFVVSALLDNSGSPYYTLASGTAVSQVVYDFNQHIFRSQSGATEYARFISNGNFGIGNSAPNAKLQVTGTANVSGNVAIAGITTFTGNIVLGSVGLSSNGSFGTAGHVLHSNGTATYWAADDAGGGTVTSVATGNGITGGTITTTGTVSILANTGIVANATGVFVNATYINTISSNSATFANSSVTNTFTVGTAAYFVSNGNLGIGTTSPGLPLQVNASIRATAGGTNSIAELRGGNIDGAVLQLFRAGNTSQFAAFSQFQGSLFIKNVDTGPVIFTTTTSDTERMRITSTGDVGIGASPSDALTVARASGEAVIGIRNSGTASSWLTLSPGSSGAAYIHNVGNTATILTTNSNERMRITNSGDVGIGNNNPNARLQVTGTANVSGNVAIGGITTFSANVILGSSGLSANGGFGTAGHVLHSNGTATYWAADDNSGGTVTSVATGNGMTGGTITTTGTVSVLANTGIVANATGIYVNAAYINTISSNSATFANSSVTNTFTVGTAAYFISNGHFGIGTSTPAARLAVEGNNIFLSANDASPRVEILNRGNNTTARFPALTVTHYTGNATGGDTGGQPVIELFRLRGSVGSLLPVQSGDILGGYNTWGSNSTASLSATRIQGVAEAAFTTTATAGLQFITTSAGTQSEKVRITATGNVGISNTAPTQKLHIQGTGLATTDFRAPIFYDSDNTAFYVDPASTSIVNNAQITTLGVGTTASGTTGEIRATNNITAYFSDKRLKDIKSTIPNALDKVMSLSGVLYTSNEIAAKYGYKDQFEQVGVIAQEVESVLPQIVKRAPFDSKYVNGQEVSISGENYKTVQYEKLVPLLIEAIKDQQGQIEVMKAEMNKLKGVN
jgi:hypothetical protein